jgi:transcriptional regulator with GAF, ATPase, and Fis domain
MNQVENKTKASKNNNQYVRTTEAASEPVATDSPQSDPHFSLRSLRAEAEVYAISRTLEYTGWNRRRAAQLLSISYRGILYKIRQHNLTPTSGRELPTLGQELKAEAE